MRTFYVKQLVRLHHQMNVPFFASERPRPPPPENITRTQIETLYDIINRMPIGGKPEQGGWVEYVNENDPEEGVVVRNANGVAIMYMPLDVYDAAQKETIDAKTNHTT